MKKLQLMIPVLCGLLLFVIPYSVKKYQDKQPWNESASEENEDPGYDGPDKAAELEFRKTMDPALGRVPRERLIPALDYAVASRSLMAERTSGFGVWTERGPNSDVNGPSGNTRPNGDVTAGRMRAIWVDLADATGKTVFVAGVDGGVWKTTDITVSPATWTLVNDYLSNMAVTSITQSPANTNIMYFCTGESFFNADAVAGDGIFKSTDHGITWTQLSATTSASFDYCSKIVCDNSGNVYVTTRSGVFRSTDGGTSWTTITPSGLSTSRFTDVEISNTGRLHVSAGDFSTCAYRYTDNPATVTSVTWTAATAGYPASSVRIELICSGNTLFALPADASYQVPTIYKSTDGGANWAATTGQPIGGWASQQAWYALSGAINPGNTNEVIVGGLDSYKTTDGGATWSKISTWVGTTGQYVHADIHNIVWYNGGNIVLWGSDGGIFYSADKGTTIRDRNTGLRLKQFYSVAIHPSTTNYFLAGAQDNGCHSLTSAGLGSSTEVTGGDGAYVMIDQNEPQYQFGSYVYNQYRRSTNGGANWTSVNFSASLGQFINPIDYDNTANIMYCAYSAGTYKRWTNPQTGTTSANIAIPELASTNVTAITVSPYTANRVYLGTDGGLIVRVDNANTVASGSSGTLVSTGLPAAYINCVATGTNDNNLMACFTNYGIQQIWVSSNGGSTWTNIDGNLPDMPVRWCMFVPGANNRAIIATEAGVWYTEQINGGSTVWSASATFPAVRTDMIKYRPMDNLIAAATHGRGIWTQNMFSILPLNNFVLQAKWSNNAASLQWSFEDAGIDGAFIPEYSTDGKNFTAAGTVTEQPGRKSYSYTHVPGASLVYYRVKHVTLSGTVLYSNVVKLLKNGAAAESMQIISVYPNPVKSLFKVAFTSTVQGRTQYLLTSVSGQTVWAKEEDMQFSGNFIRSWDISALPAGTYIFTIRNGQNKVSQQVVKQ